MFKPPSPSTKALVAALALVGLGACSQDSPLAPTALGPALGPALHDAIDAKAGAITVGTCSGPAGLYHYHTNAVGGGPFRYPDGADRQINYPNPPSCSSGGLTFVYIPTTPESWAAGVKAKVTITATEIPKKLQVDSIQSWVRGVPQPTVRRRKSVTVSVGFTDEALVIFYFGHTPQGCNSSYWKATQHYPSWAESGLVPTQLVGSLFANASQQLDGKPLSEYTLGDALRFRGNASNAAGAAQALVRAAVAAELNARRPQFGYPLTALEVADATNKSLATGSRANMRVRSILFELLNNIGCPLR